MHPDSHILLHQATLTGYDVRCALIRGSRRTLLWDTLAHPDQLLWLPTRPDFTVYSHADWDHIWGAAAVHDSVVIAQQQCAARFTTDVPKTLAEFQTKEPEQWKDVRLIAPLLAFEHYLHIDLGDLSVELRHLPGHTPDSIVAFVPEIRTLFVGDTVESPCPCVPEGADLDTWIDQLRRWLEHPLAELVIPSHGAVGGKEAITETIAYLTRLISGESWELAADASPFYRDTHLENLHNRKISL